MILLLLKVKRFIDRLSHCRPRRSHWHALATTYLLTLTNPATILSFIAIFAGLGLGTVNPTIIDAVILVLGITLGSAIWWLMLSSGVAYILHHRLSPNLMQWINRVSGIIILVFGICALLYENPYM